MPESVGMNFRVFLGHLSATAVLNLARWGQAYMELAKQVDMAVQFMNAAGLHSSSAIMSETEFYVSHEALLLDYEQALTREDSTTGRWSSPSTQHY